MAARANDDAAVQLEHAEAADRSVVAPSNGAVQLASLMRAALILMEGRGDGH